MSTEIIYKYPKCKEFIEIYCDDSIYLNPHANIIDFINNNPTQIDNYWLSRNSSNKAIDMLMENYDLIDISGLVLNKNPRIGPLLELTMNLFDESDKIQLSHSKNPAVMNFLTKYPEFINWNGLSANNCKEAITMLKNNPDKINRCIIQACNPAINELIQDNYYWYSICMNPYAIKIIEKQLNEDPTKIDFDGLARNTNAIHLISKHLDKISPFWLSTNTKAMDILITHPELIDFDSLLTNSNAISYIETRLQDITNDNMHKLAINKKCVILIQKMCDLGMINEDNMEQAINNCMINYEYAFELDYQAMSKNRVKIIYSELIEKALKPSRIEEWLDDHIKNGKDISDFDFI